MAKRKSFWVQDDYNRRKTLRQRKKEQNAKVSEEDLIEYDQSLKEEFWFPPWGKYLAWFLSITVIVSCSVVLALYGATFGVVKSKIWLITVLMSMAFSTFLVQPVKAVALAMVLSYVFKSERMGYHKRLTADMLQNPYDAAKAAEVAKLRTADCYTPPSESEIKARKAEIFRQTQLKTLIFDISIYTLCLTVLYLLAMNNKSGTTFFSTETAKRLIITADYTHSIPYMRVKTQEQFYEYLSETLIPGLLKNEILGYKPLQMINAIPAVGNETAMHDRGHTMDPNVKLLGQPMIRQLRVQTKSCDVHPAAGPTRLTDCRSELSYSTMDTDSYTLGWKKYEEGDPQPPGLEWQPWQYDAGDDILRVGRLRSSQGGGYEMNLGKTISNAHETLDFIQYFHWIDSRTRVVYIDFTLFSVGAGLFNVVTLLLDVSASGVFIPSYTITTAKFLTPDWSDLILHIILLGTFTVLLLIFAASELLKIKRISMRSYIKSAWSLLNSFIIIFGWIKIISEISQLVSTQKLMKDLEIAAHKDYVNFRKIAFWDYFSNCIDSLLVLAASVRILKSFAFHQYFHYWELFLKAAGLRILAFYAMVIVLLVIFGISFSLYLGKYQEDFTYVWGSMSTLLYYSMRKHEGFDPDFLIRVPTTAILYTVYLICISLLILLFFGTVSVFVEKIYNHQPLRSRNYFQQYLTFLLYGGAKPQTVISQFEPRVRRQPLDWGQAQVDEIRLLGIKRLVLEMLTGKNHDEQIALNITGIVLTGKSRPLGTDSYHIATYGDEFIAVSDRKLKEMQKIADRILRETVHL